MRKQFAVFDIDGTITRNSLLSLMIKELVSREKLAAGKGRDIEVMLHDSRQSSSDEEFSAYMRRAVDDLFNALPDGLRTDDFNEVIAAVVTTCLTNTYVYTRELVQTLRKNNYFLISISGSELHAVEALSRKLGFDAWVGAVSYEQADGRLTGEVKQLDKPKSEVLQEIIQKFGLQTKGSMAVGDTSTDIDVFKMVDNPIAFNPNQSLFKAARQNGWMVVIERKDMVYGMQMVDGQYVLKQVNA